MGLPVLPLVRRHVIVTVYLLIKCRSGYDVSLLIDVNSYVTCILFAHFQNAIVCPRKSFQNSDPEGIGNRVLWCIALTNNETKLIRIVLEMDAANTMKVKRYKTWNPD